MQKLVQLVSTVVTQPPTDKSDKADAQQVARVHDIDSSILSQSVRALVMHVCSERTYQSILSLLGQLSSVTTNRDVSHLFIIYHLFSLKCT